jgi:hypothetical protein
MKMMISIGIGGLILMYGAILFVCVVLWRKTRQNAIITDTKQEKLQLKSESKKAGQHVWTQQMVDYKAS